MNSKRNPDPSHQVAPAPEGGVRSAVWWMVAGLLGLGCVALAWWTWRPSAPLSAAAPETSPAETRQDARVKENPPELRPAGSQVPGAPASGPALSPKPTLEPAVAVDPAISALVNGLKSLGDTNLVLTAEAVGSWRTNLQHLAQQGAAAVPGIAAFLREQADVPFGPEARQAAGYASARLAALEALRQIGGPEALALMDKTLGETSSPRELAVLTRNLEEASPEQYRGKALSLAQAMLDKAVAGKLGDADVAPVFEIYQRYGDASVVPELEKASGQWRFYAAVALANLPEGAGLPSLLRMADPTTGSRNRLVALQMLAQMATDYPAAKNFLVSQVSDRAIPPNLWPSLRSPLAGDQYYPVDAAITPYPATVNLSHLQTTQIGYGNQNLYTIPGYQSLSPEAINQRLALVDEMLKTAPDPAAVQTLQQARESLLKPPTRAAPPTTARPTTGQ